MAAVEDLEIIVDVDIAEAITKLEDLQDELQDVADEIRNVRRAAAGKIDIDTHVEPIEDDLARMALMIEGWERVNSINIGTSVDDVDMPSGGGGGGGGGGGRGRPPSAISALVGLGRRNDMRDNLRKLKNRFAQLAENSAITNINMSDLHNLLARLLPLLLVFIGALPAAIAGVVGLAAAAVSAAAALAAIAGFGALGVALVDGQFDGERLTRVMEDIRDDFIEAFAPLAKQLQPIFMDAVSGMETFFNTVASQGDALMALTDEAQAFGNFLIEFTPNLLRSMAALVESLSYIFGNIGDAMTGQVADASRELARITAEVMPALGNLVNMIIAALPAIVEFSLGFLMVANILIKLIGGFAKLANILGVSNQALGFIVATVLTLISVFAVGAMIVGSTFVSAIGGYITALGGMISSTVAGIQAITGLTLSATAAKIAVLALWSAITLGGALVVTGVLEGLSSKFDGVAGSVNKATNAMEDFDRVQGGIQDDFGGGGSGNPYGYEPDNPRKSSGSGGGTTVFNVESSGDPEADDSNLRHADWMSGRTTRSR